MVSSGILIFLRWASHIPFFMTVSAKTNYDAAVSLKHLYETLPHGDTFLHGLAITGHMVSAANLCAVKTANVIRY